jgi:hypothetical protein
MVHTSAAGTTVYVAEGQPVPTELHPDVVLVGPGSGEEVDVAEKAKAEAAKAEAKTKAAKKAV